MYKYYVSIKNKKFLRNGPKHMNRQFYCLQKKIYKDREWQPTPIIQTTWEAEMIGLQFEVSPGKKVTRSYPKKQAGCGSACQPR
jgi:hypothetical protein